MAPLVWIEKLHRPIPGNHLAQRMAPATDQIRPCLCLHGVTVFHTVTYPLRLLPSKTQFKQRDRRRYRAGQHWWRRSGSINRISSLSSGNGQSTAFYHALNGVKTPTFLIYCHYFPAWCSGGMILCQYVQFRDTYNKIRNWAEYSECLIRLVINVLYNATRTSSSGWRCMDVQ